MTDYLKDKNGNRASIAFFGTKEKAQRALNSLVNCKNCKNCADCKYCTECRNCKNCWNCAGGRELTGKKEQHND